MFLQNLTKRISRAASPAHVLDLAANSIGKAELCRCFSQSAKWKVMENRNEESSHGKSWKVMENRKEEFC